MAVRVISPALSEDLTTVTRTKTFLGISGSSEDTLLAMLITGASSMIASEFTRPLVRQSYQEDIAGSDRGRICLSRWPVDPDQVTVTIDGEAVTDFHVESPARGILYRQCGWPSIFNKAGEDGETNVRVTYPGGYLLASMVSSWATATVYVRGSWVRSSSLSALRFECTTAGSSGTPEPTWPTVAGTTVADGSAVWTARDAREIPAAIEQLAFLAIQDMRERRLVPSFLASEAVDGVQASYFAMAGQSALPKSVLDGCDRWRYSL
jgi:hypothetical protein